MSDCMLDVALWANVATIVGAPVGVFALIYGVLQLRSSVRVNQGQFMLELEKMIATHDAVHLKLRPGGAWATSPVATAPPGNQGAAPATVEEWAQVEDYMGFFEHCELLLRDRSLTTERFQRLFGYRVANILANGVIAEAKLVREREHWSLFLDLIRRLGFKDPGERSGT